MGNMLALWKNSIEVRFRPFVIIFWHDELRKVRKSSDISFSERGNADKKCYLWWFIGLILQTGLLCTRVKKEDRLRRVLVCLSVYIECHVKMFGVSRTVYWKCYRSRNVRHVNPGSVKGVAEYMLCSLERSDGLNYSFKLEQTCWHYGISASKWY